MTVEELRDALDKYIKKDPPDLWQLNDVEADAKAYEERCKKRSKSEVIIFDDGMKATHYGLLTAYGTTIYRDFGARAKGQDVFALCIDLANPLK